MKRSIVETDMGEDDFGVRKESFCWAYGSGSERIKQEMNDLGRVELIVKCDWKV